MGGGSGKSKLANSVPIASFESVRSSRTSVDRSVPIVSVGKNL